MVGNCPGALSKGELFMGNCQGGKSLGSNCPWGKLSGGQLTRRKLLRGNCLGGKSFGGIVLGE